ncbi:MAG: glycerophosphodiester phosphodiesterase [Chloroflexia bacterium]
MSEPLLVAHRGGAAEAPENTLAAFRRALSLGVRWFELDVQMSRDGELVVIHDHTVDRTTNGTGEVGSLSLQDLRKLDSGSWFDPHYRGEPVPTLREMLELCASHGAGVLVEMKSPHLYPGIEQKVATLLGEMRVQGAHDFWCISFDHADIDRLHEIDPTLPLGYLYTSFVTDFVPTTQAVQAACPHFSTVSTFPAQVEQAHQLGKRVFTWTVNTEPEMKLMAQLGVDAIITDRPSLFLSIQ